MMHGLKYPTGFKVQSESVQSREKLQMISKFIKHRGRFH